MIKRILVGLAGTNYTEQAVRRAVELTKIHSAEITGVTVMDPRNLRVGSIPAGAGSVAVELREHRKKITIERIEEAISGFESICEQEGIAYRVAREEGNAFRLMQNLARFHDLTVFGLRSIFEYYFDDADSSTILSRLLAEGVRPILAVASVYRPIKRVLLGYSGSMESAKTIRRFVQEQHWPDATLKIVNFSPKADKSAPLLDEAVDYCRTHGFQPESEYLRGSPAHGFLKHADDWNADLLVLGNSARSFLIRQIFGDTALYTIKNADRPLFLSN